MLATGMDRVWGYLLVLISCSSIINASRSPSIVNTTSDKQLSIIKDNEQVTLTCEVTGDNITGGYWMRVNDDELSNRNNVSSLSHDKRTITITIKRARPTHSGKYRCVVYNQWGVVQSRKHDVRVTITIAPPMFTSQPASYITPALKDVTFTCEAKGFEVKYEWKRHNGNVTGGRQSSLTISRATPSDEDQYYCVAMTEGGYAFSNNVTLTVNDYIIISQHSQSVTLATGNVLTLNVTAIGPGSKKFEYRWKRRGSTSLSNRAEGQETSSLKIRSVTTSDSGSYYCAIKNHWGNMIESNDATVTVWPLPVITIHPKGITIAEGSDVKLTCEATGDGTLNYQWRRVSGSLQRNSGRQTLTIRNIAVDDSGQYYCEVDNGGEKVTSKRAEVAVRRVPSITNNSNNVQLSIVSGNEQVTLTCEVTGDDITGGYWERVNDDPLPVNNNMSSLSDDKRALALTISTARPTHSGRYRCVVYSQWGVAQSRNITVTITIAPPMITTQPTNQMITALQNVTFTYEVEGFDVKYEWKRHTGSVTGSRVTGRRRSVLAISRATPLDEDQYYCVAITEGGYAFSHNVTLTVNDMLSIQVTPTSLQIGERATAVFIATASGVNMNNFMYQWRKRGSDSLPHKVSGVSETTLTIPNLIASDGGQYHCIVTNEWGNSVESDNVILTVEVGLPVFQRHPQDQFINNRHDATFECFVNGSNSTLNVTWERNRNQYNLGNLNNIVHSNGVRSILTINTATVSDDGKYRCRATNVDGKSAASNEADLIIIPEMRLNPKNVTELIGQSTELICRAQGSEIIYHWVKNDISLGDTNSRMLRITNITESDEGVYKCVASNKVGRAESNAATVTVYGPPMIKNIPVQLHAVFGEAFHITCTATNDQNAPMNLTLSWTAPSGVDIITTNKHGGLTTTSTLHVSDVTHNHSGVYVCTANNGEHPGNYISITSTMLVEEKSSPPTSLNITDINPTSFKLIWSSPTNPHGVISYYTVYYINISHNHFVQVVNDANFDGTYILTNLSPYTVYIVYVTAVRFIEGDTDRPLEGMKSAMLIERTLAGVPIIKYDNESKIILNADSTVDDKFTIDLPAISLFSYLYIIVLTDDVVTNTESISTAMLLEESMKSHPLYYVAAVVNVSQYVLGKGLSYILGAGDSTTDINNEVFYNRKVNKNYLYFFRIFSFDSTLENEVYITTKPQKVKSSQLVGLESNECTKNSDTESSDTRLIVIAVLAVLLVVLLICVIVLTVVILKLKMQHPAPDKNNSDQQHPSDPPESEYALVSKSKDGNVNMEANPAYSVSVQDTPMLHQYDFITDENNQTKAS